MRARTETTRYSRSGRLHADFPSTRSGFCGPSCSRTIASSRTPVSSYRVGAFGLRPLSCSPPSRCPKPSRACARCRLKKLKFPRGNAPFVYARTQTPDDMSIPSPSARDPSGWGCAAFALRPFRVARDRRWCAHEYPRWGAHTTMDRTPWKAPLQLPPVLGAPASIMESELPRYRAPTLCRR